MGFDKIITKTIQINASLPKLWDALTNPEIMKLWLWEGEMSISSEWQVGSPIIFRGKFYKAQYEDKGTILKLEKEKVFQYSYWGKLSQLPDAPENYTIIEFALSTKEAQTILTLTQSNCITYEIYAHWNFYWLVTLDIFKKLVEKE
jgi:uncharacterized protein YndB with AHSA1/START domain